MSVLGNLHLKQKGLFVSHVTIRLYITGNGTTILACQGCCTRLPASHGVL